VHIYTWCPNNDGYGSFSDVPTRETMFHSDNSFARLKQLVILIYLWFLYVSRVEDRTIRGDSTTLHSILDFVRQFRVRNHKDRLGTRLNEELVRQCHQVWAR
jgi:hypothetical protein